MPATGKPRRAYLDDGEIAALLAALDGTGQAGPAPQSLAGLRAKLERVAGRGSVLLVECVLGDDYKEAVPCKAGRLAYVNEGYFSQVWHEVLPAVLFRAEDGRYCALRLDLDIVEADLCDAWWLVKDRLHADEWDGVEEGDAAQVEYLKGHLAALEAQAAEAGLAVADRKAAWAGPEGAAAGS